MRSVTVSDSFSSVSSVTQHDAQHPGDNQYTLKEWMRTWKALGSLESQGLGLWGVLNGQKKFKWTWVVNSQLVIQAKDIQTKFSIFLPRQVLGGPPYLNCCVTAFCSCRYRTPIYVDKEVGAGAEGYRCWHETPCQLGSWDLPGWGAAAVSFLFFSLSGGMKETHWMAAFPLTFTAMW